MPCHPSPPHTQQGPEGTLRSCRQGQSDAYRAATGDETPAVIVSTASPFKFAADVCVALGADAGADPLAALSAYCAIPTPAPLSGLGDRPVRFDGVTEKADMRATVDGFLR